MKTARLAISLAARAVIIAAAFAASAAMAQAVVPVAPGTTAADIAPAPGLPGPASVNPAPGATGPYAGHSESAFYDVRGRIAKVEARIDANLQGADKRKAMSQLTSIKSEERAQVARHGSLLDWARENLNHKLDLLVQAYPSLAG